MNYQLSKGALRAEYGYYTDFSAYMGKREWLIYDHISTANHFSSKFRLFHRRPFEPYKEQRLTFLVYLFVFYAFKIPSQNLYLQKRLIVDFHI